MQAVVAPGEEAASPQAYPNPYPTGLVSFPDFTRFLAPHFNPTRPTSTTTSTMPFPYALPTTGSANLSDFLTSGTHPSLPLLATTKRSLLKDALKKHKRTPPRDQPSHLPAVQDAINQYLPYLLALNTASGYRDVGNEEVDVETIKPLQVEWRTTISATLPGREPPRSKVTGLHHELAFTLSTLAYTHSLLARSQLRILYGSHVLSPEQRTNAIGTAMKHLLQAHSIQSFLLSLPSTAAAAKDAPTDIQPSTITALAALAMAEATLIVVAKDDPYAAAVADDRNENNTDWMYKSPTIPKVRARLYAGIALAAAEHANQAHGLLARSTAGKVDEDLVGYANDLKRTARAKAIRFLAVNAELSGSTGEALAWLNGAKRELGIASDKGDEGKRRGLRGLKQSWQERREDKRIEKGGEWGLDGGRLEECRVVEMLDAKWDRENSAVNVQLVPEFEPLLAQMPSGREYHTPEPWSPPTLDAGTLMQMRALPEPQDRAFKGDEDDSGDEGGYRVGTGEPVGAFPGTATDYGRSKTSSSYY
jgi:hypothetical protein